MLTQTKMTQQKRIKVIAVGGPAQNGKSTLCHLLQSQASLDGWHCQRFSFADPLKSIVRIVQQDFVRKNPLSLQTTSDHWKSSYGKTCFAKDLVARFDAYVQTVPAHFNKLLFFVDDLRYIHEVEILQSWASASRDLVFVKVHREGYDATDRDLTHSSETELKTVDYHHYYIDAIDMDQLTEDALELWTKLRT